MSDDLVGNPEDRFSPVAARICTPNINERQHGHDILFSKMNSY